MRTLLLFLQVGINIAGYEFGWWLGKTLLHWMQT